MYCTNCTFGKIGVVFFSPRQISESIQEEINEALVMRIEEGLKKGVKTRRRHCTQVLRRWKHCVFNLQAVVFHCFSKPDAEY